MMCKIVDVMAKKLISVIFLSLISFLLFASFNATLLLSPDLSYSNYPLFDLTLSPYSDEYRSRGFYETKQDVYYRYFEDNRLGDIGFSVEDEYFRIVFDIDIRGTLNSYYEKRTYSNIPYDFSILNNIFDLNFPRYAFGEFRAGNLFLSAGRRPLNWGGATHNIALSSDVPFLDSIWAEYNISSLRYNFVYISTNRAALRNAESQDKTIILHSIGYNSDFLKFTIGELNLIYGRIPNLVDISPFGVYHNLYQNYSNVMLYLDAEWLVIPSLRIYSEFAMDDFDLPTESHEKGKPSAHAVMAGIEWQIINGKESSTIRSDREKYTLSSPSLGFSTGLLLSYEIYFCNPYMYNREREDGKFTVPLYMDGYRSIAEPNAFYLGFKFGPNSLYQKISIGYISGNISTNLDLGLLIRGSSYTIDSKYGTEGYTSREIDYNYRYRLYGDKMTTLLISSSLSWLYKPGLQIDISFSSAFDFYNKKNALSLTLAHTVSFMDLH